MIAASGSTLHVVTSKGSNLTVRVEADGSLRAASGEILSESSACLRRRPATADEIADFDAGLLTQSLADQVEARGAAGLGGLLDACGVTDRDGELFFVADVLRKRGRLGLASQVSAMRAPVVRRPTLVGVAPPAPMSAPKPTRALTPFPTTYRLRAVAS